MSILFINSSENRNGKTAKMAAELLAGKDYETLNLIDYRINFKGQDLAGDQFDEIIAKMKAADELVLGCPDYWFTINGAMRTVLDRFYGEVDLHSMSGPMYLIFQGGGPRDIEFQHAEETARAFCRGFGYEYMGMISSMADAKAFNSRI